MKSASLACLFALIAGPVAYAQSVTVTGDVKPTLTPNPTDHWDTGTNNIVVGDTSAGTLTIANGGSVTSNGGAGTLMLGRVWSKNGVLNFGSADLDNPTTGGTLNVSQIIFGEADDLAINFNQTDDVTLAASISQPFYGFNRGIYQRGTGSTTISGNNTNFWGDIKVYDGSLAIAGTTMGRDMTVSGTSVATFRVTTGGALTANDFYVANEGSGHVVIDGGGKATNNVVTIGADRNTGSALVTGAGSEWVVRSNLHIGYGGIGTLTIADGATVTAGSEEGKIYIAENSDSVGTLNIGSADLDNPTTGGTLNATSIVFGNNYDDDVGVGVINFNQTDNFTLSAPISGKGSINQRGTGVTTLTGANTYTGETNILGGTLALRGDGSIAHSERVHVAAGGKLDASGSTLTFGSDQTLSGEGTLSGEIIVQGLLSVGATEGAAGLMNFENSLTLAAASTFVFDLGGYERGVSFDAVDVIGDYEINGTLLVYLQSSFIPQIGDVFDIFNTTYSGRGGFSEIIFANSGYTGSFDAVSGALTITGHAIPEPSTYAAMAGVLALGVVAWRRRRATGSV